MLDWVRVAGLSCTKGLWYIYDRGKQHFGEIKNEVFFKERRLLRLKGPVG